MSDMCGRSDTYSITIVVMLAAFLVLFIPCPQHDRLSDCQTVRLAAGLEQTVKNQEASVYIHLSNCHTARLSDRSTVRQTSLTQFVAMCVEELVSHCALVTLLTSELGQKP
jgi:hypothetical protein